MSTRRDPERTRERLLHAGLLLADETGLAALSVNKIIAAAGTSKGAFFHHFPDRQSYLVALHRQVHDRLTVEIHDATAAIAPGSQRLMRGIEVYLDAFLRDRGVRGLLLDARSEPLILAEVARRNDQVADMIAADLHVMGWAEPQASARLLVALIAEAAIVEFGHGGLHEPTRRAIVRLLDRPG